MWTQTSRNSYKNVISIVTRFRHQIIWVGVSGGPDSIDHGADFRTFYFYFLTKKYYIIYIMSDMLHNTYIYMFQQMRHIHLSDIALTLLYLLRQYLYPYRIRYIYIFTVIAIGHI